MSTPQDPWAEGGRPAEAAPYNPYGQPGAYRAGQQPGQYSSGPLSNQSNQPYRPYVAPAHDPYGGGGPPLGPGPPVDGPRKRPTAVVGGFVLLVLAALPFLLAGATGLFAPLDASSIPPDVLTNPRLVNAGATPELLISAVRLVAGLLAVGALIYLLFAFLAFRGRNWARIVATVLSAGFVLLLLAGVASGGATGVVLGFVVLVAVAMVGGIVALYLPAANRWFSRPRR